MIERLRGIVEERGADHVLLSMGPMTVRVLTTTQTLGELGAGGGTAQLYTHLYMREDVVTLYGFATASERELFERLIAITGVGPRMALSLLSGFSVERLGAAIDADDVALLTRVPGVGRKTAQRVILELRGKLAPLESPATGGPRPADAELVDALTGLGFTQAQASSALGSLADEEGLSDEEKLRAAIRYLGSR
ncbi:MAG: Holliday junction branch migration protein RuvA [Chloroflexota bacterium]